MSSNCVLVTKLAKKHSYKRCLLDDRDTYNGFTKTGSIVILIDNTPYVLRDYAANYFLHHVNKPEPKIVVVQMSIKS